MARKGHSIPELAHRLQYKYDTHWLPHDARAKTLAAKGKSIIEQLAAALGLKYLAIVPNIGVEDGIQAARMAFPRMWFDQQGCDDGLKALRRYQRELQQDERSLQLKPKHNWTSHYADAFRMLAVAWQHQAEEAKAPEPERAVSVFQNTTTLNDLWAETPTQRTWRI